MSHQSTMPSLGKTIDEATGLKSGIYRIACRSNGKVYIGSAVKISQRWCQHRFDLARDRHPNRHLQAAWLKYGVGDFAFEVVEWVDPARLIEREQVHIDAARAAERSHGFNAIPRAGSRLGATQTAEARLRMSEAKRGRTCKPFTAEHRMRLAEAQRGRKSTDETRQKISEAKRGKPLLKPHSDEHRRKLSDAHRGKTLSEAHKQKLSEAARNRYGRTRVVEPPPLDGTTT